MGRRSKKKRGFPLILIILPTLLISAAGIGSTWLFSQDKTPKTNSQQISLGALITDAPKTEQGKAPEDQADTNMVQQGEQNITVSPTPTNVADSSAKKSNQTNNNQTPQTTTTNSANKSAGQTDKKPQKSDLAQIQVPVPLPVDATKVENKAESIVGQDVAVDDFMTAGMIFMKKLTPTEISFLFGAANGRMLENNSVEELENIRKMLLSKLTSQEVATIRSIGKKYGRTMYILDPSISIAEIREQHFKKLAEQQNN